VDVFGLRYSHDPEKLKKKVKKSKTLKKDPKDAGAFGFKEPAKPVPRIENIYVKQPELKFKAKTAPAREEENSKNSGANTGGLTLEEMKTKMQEILPLTEE